MEKSSQQIQELSEIFKEIIHVISDKIEEEKNNFSHLPLLLEVFNDYQKNLSTYTYEEKGQLIGKWRPLLEKKDKHQSLWQALSQIKGDYDDFSWETVSYDVAKGILLDVRAYISVHFCELEKEPKANAEKIKSLHDSSSKLTQLEDTLQVDNPYLSYRVTKEWGGLFKLKDNDKTLWEKLESGNISIPYPKEQILAETANNILSNISKKIRRKAYLLSRKNRGKEDEVKYLQEAHVYIDDLRHGIRTYNPEYSKDILNEWEPLLEEGKEEAFWEKIYKLIE
ncbi:hypothetical protein FAI41_07795 [Acetobacteraceae bacterium]|nr:hypothetical protein FAI41_07795 [Acetobacteraceae bacterium]